MSTSGNNVSNTNSGNVGIGTSAPTSKLEVAGQVKITGGAPGAGKVLTSDAAGLASWVTPGGTIASGTAAGNTPYWDGTSWITNSSNIFNNGGNVGIGTTSPGTKLDVSRADAAGDGDAISFGSQSYKMGKLGEITSDNGVYLANVYGANAYIDFRVAGNAVSNTKMRVHGNGNVGIGTLSPDAKLETEVNAVSGAAIMSRTGLSLTNSNTTAVFPAANDVSLTFAARYARPGNCWRYLWKRLFKVLHRCQFCNSQGSNRF
ncbi:MAG: hypothetical protein IPJ79_07700 [Bacteroidetes bacterium]|nr:hypothetical protein [Bacteroidota bacterium]